MVHTKIKYFLFLFLLLCSFTSPMSEGSNDINKISKEQKAYELSVVWKELSYNFGNIDNCPDLNIDSLYREYLPLITETENDFEYYKMMQRFMAHFNNGHTLVYGVPDHLVEHLAYPMLQTSYQDGHIIVENFGSRYKNVLSVGDTIVRINGLNAVDYFYQEHVPYVCASNQSYKIHYAMFDFNNTCNLTWRDKEFYLEIKNGEKIKKVTVVSDYYLDKKSKNNQDTWFFNDNINLFVNGFEIDTINSFAYIDLHRCDKSFQQDFERHYPQIQKCKNLIIDISNNIGGYSNYTDTISGYLISSDSIKTANYLYRYNNAWWKSYYAFLLDADKQKQIDISENASYYLNHTFQSFNNCFKPKLSQISIGKNPIPKDKRYQGNVFVIIGRNTVSAAETFAIQVSQNKNIVFLGEKTAGANSQPLRFTLPSGLKVMINGGKVYDFDLNDVSSGFTPDYNVNLSSYYKTYSRKKLLENLIDVISKLVEN